MLMANDNKRIDAFEMRRLAKDAENTINCATNQTFNRQRNIEAGQAKCFMRETHSKVFWIYDQETSRKC